MTRFLITGGCGSIGDPLVRRLLNKGHTVCSLDSSEEKLFHQISKLSQQHNQSQYKPFLGDVRDSSRLVRAFQGVDYVFHCAALKHVALCEYNPFEALKTNVEGSHNVVEACIQANVKKLVFASSDKAVNPTSTMGASKLLAERIILSASSYAGASEFTTACVRFGNVWDTAGSVGQIFLDQIKRGKPLTLTSKDMTRFFITIDKALDLCEFALSDMEGGEIFISNMGALGIYDLALAYNNYFSSDIPIDIIGHKPGEKLYEELFTEQEAPSATIKNGYYILHPRNLSKQLATHPSLSLRSDASDVQKVDPIFLINELNKNE